MQAGLLFWFDLNEWMKTPTVSQLVTLQILSSNDFIDFILRIGTIIISLLLFITYLYNINLYLSKVEGKKIKYLLDTFIYETNDSTNTQKVGSSSSVFCSPMSADCLDFYVNLSQYWWTSGANCKANNLNTFCPYFVFQKYSDYSPDYIVLTA